MESDRGKHRVRTVAIVVAVAVVTLVAAYAVITRYVAQTYKVPGQGMEPAIAPGGRVVVDKLAYLFHTPRPGDVIVFDAPTGWIPNRPPGRFDVVKRVIAVGGQKVQCREDGGMTVDGKPIREPYVDAAVTGPSGLCHGFEFGPVTVPHGRLWVMGDNRTHSADSRTHCTMSRSEESGVFCIGDQPAATVPTANVVGRVAYVYTPPFGFRGFPSDNPQSK